MGAILSRPVPRDPCSFERFLELPLEIRCMIYRHLLPSPRTVVNIFAWFNTLTPDTKLLGLISGNQSSHLLLQPLLNLMKTSRSVRQEVAILFYPQLHLVCRHFEVTSILNRNLTPDVKPLIRAMTINLCDKEVNAKFRKGQLKHELVSMLRQYSGLHALTLIYHGQSYDATTKGTAWSAATLRCLNAILHDSKNLTQALYTPPVRRWMARLSTVRLISSDSAAIGLEILFDPKAEYQTWLNACRQRRAQRGTNNNP